MYASSTGPRSALRRRGIVLVLVLGMLGLMALIGVTFATFAGQSLKNGRNFSQGLGRPQPEALMDYALAQLINDTNNPLSAIRGHSLLRDMYGNDSVYRGSNPPQNAVAETGGIISTVYDGGYTTLHFTAVQARSAATPPATPFYNQLQYQTNIPTTGPYQGYDFTRWIIRFSSQSGPQTNSVPQTFEILEDDYSTAYHKFTLSASLGNPRNDPYFSGTPLSSSDSASFVYGDPNLGATTSGSTVSKAFTAPNREFAGIYGGTIASTSNSFILDGRYMRAFNGPGMTRPSYIESDSSGNVVFNPAYPFNPAAYANMRVIGGDPAVQSGLYPNLFGLGDPDSQGMDEDYDACDLENWFLAIQSADGQVMIPSFHRPGILTAADWTLPVYNTAVTPPTIINAANRSKILRPRQVDNSPLFPSDPSTLDSHGKLTYDIDNDGDGVTDSVWLDLGYPAQRDPNGKLYKPLFAFMILGLNGRLPLNTVGNLQARAIGDTTNNSNDSVMYPVSTGQVPYAGVYADSGNHRHQYSSQVFFDSPLYDHASHVGYSVNEINPKFALQNAPSNVYSASSGDAYGVSYAQYDDAGLPVALTQLRNILAGTKPAAVTNPYTGTLPTSTSLTIQTSGNGDSNIVAVNGLPWVLPNGVYDAHDNNGGAAATVRSNAPVAGRWGEPSGVPTLLPTPYSSNNTFDPTYPMLWYNNQVRAGRSIFTPSQGQATQPTNDALDDDHDGFDPYLPNPLESPNNTTFTLDTTTGSGAYNVIPLYPNVAPYTALPAYAGPTFTRLHPEDVDLFDNAGMMAVPVERSRRFVTPQDPGGVGRMVAFYPTTTGEQFRPARDYDYGKGSDSRGRVGFFRYFRPAGMPQEVIYPYADASTASVTDFPYTYTTNSGNGQRYLMPVLLPAGRSQATSSGPVSTPDVSSNRLHGLQAVMTPQLIATGNYLNAAQAIATQGAMPFDYDPYIGGTPGGYNDTDYGGGTKIQLYSPTINPNTTILQSAVNSLNGPNLGAAGDPMTGNIYPIPYGGTYNQQTVTRPDNSTFMIEQPAGAPVVNGYLDGGLNKDEADEMNLYSANMQDMPFGPSDLEWLYRKHDVDGATLTSRLSQLAPISFLNQSDGLTRRRLFSTDAWDLISFAYANDNPIPYAGTLAGLGAHSTDHDFTYNSRFMPKASPSLEIMNQVVSVNPSYPQFTQFANPIATEFLPNPTLPVHTGNGDSFTQYVPNSHYVGSPLTLPAAINPAQPNSATAPYNMFATNAFTNAHVSPYSNVIIPSGDLNGNNPLSAAQVQTPTVAHRDRKINLNFPLPISNDPAEPIRQKWCRETYQFLKAILPPAAVDTPEELAALSQYVVNIIDFRDTDASMTRFVNTDLVVTDVLTKQASPAQSGTFNAAWTVSPAGVRFANAGDTFPASTPTHFPYDPSLYNPNTTPTCTYLVQHGMEYSPVAINEAMAYQAEYATSSTATAVTPYHAMFVELVNTLTESQNNPGSPRNSSAVSLAGWDIVVVPDNYGWGRPDPIAGDVNPIAVPVYVPNSAGSITTPPAPSDWINASNTDMNWTQLQKAVAQYSLPNDGSATIVAQRGSNNPNVFIIGDYRTGSNTSPTVVADGSTIEGGTAAVAPRAQINVHLPTTFTIPVAPNNQGMYYWVYLRRPANPFDTDVPNQVRPNKEMVVVDAMRFPVISATGASFTPAATATQPPTNIVKSKNVIYSAQRMQPYRGGHLLTVNTDPTKPTGFMAVTSLPTSGPASGVTTVCPPSPPYAYGYSEQIAASSAGNGYGSVANTPASGNPVYSQLTQTIRQSINNTNGTLDANWAMLPFHDRDFNSVAELLLVPGCPPGLFTKQFVEEQYPGNIYADTSNPHTSYAKGTDNGNSFASAPYATAGVITAPVGTTNPSLVGRQNFNFTTLPAVSTFPYLTDNFYYTAASVAPPIPGTGASLDTNYTQLTTEIGGWTGAGWHKMMEFFEVPSSANGAIGTADGGNNYDWARADIKPGQLNLNLIIDEEVFAGLIDDPRLNESLAVPLAGLLPSYMPYVVSQIDQNGYPIYNTSSGAITGRYPLFADSSVNIVGIGGVATPVTLPVGRGYIYRDPNILDYPSANAPTYNYQQVHGIKAAFSDFLKLRHGGSGYLFAHGGGDVAMGDFTPGPLVLSNGIASPPTQPVSADRPYRSLSYPDINYTIMRPASLPPSPSDSTHIAVSPGTTPPLPTLLGSLFTYNPATGVPFVQLNQLLAPMDDTANGKYQYVQDPGIKNPYLPVQYANPTSPTQGQPTSDPYLSGRRLAPPYLATDGPSTTPAKPIAAPFPPTIPPTPARRLFQIPDATITSNASYTGGYDSTGTVGINQYPVNLPVSTAMLSTGNTAYPPLTTPPTLVPQYRAVFAADNYTPQSSDPTIATPVQANNFLGAGSTGNAPTDDYRQHPAYRTEWLQKVSNLTTVRTHQFAVWITVGFFEVVKTGTPELGIPDVLGQELSAGAGRTTRYRSFFVIDRTKATGFNPYYPGNFRDCVTYRRRIE